MRHILQIEVDQSPLVGTYHSPGSSFAEPARDERRVGVLIFNSGFLPRSAAGDLGSQLADHLADLGYHVFRFDMPGLGDSPGDLHQWVVPFFRHVGEGGHVPRAVGLVASLNRRFSLQGMILCGNCGGAVTAVFAAQRVRENVLGVIQLDPDFNLAVFDGINPPRHAGAKGKAIRVAKSVRQSLRTKILQTPVGDAVRTAYLTLSRATRTGVRHVIDKIFGERLPPRANLPLIRCWEQLAAAETPMLVLMADRSKAPPGRYDYICYLMRKRPRSVTHFEVARTSHSFATDGGKEAVRRHVEDWLILHAPLRNKMDVARPPHTPRSQKIPLGYGAG